MCPLQCNGNGACLDGFCKCEPGWYGTDCGQRASSSISGREDSSARKLHTTHPEDDVTFGNSRGLKYDDEGDDPEGDGRKTSRHRRRRHPLIYVYNLPPDYNARLLQYKINPTACSWRGYEGNGTDLPTILEGNGYAVETYLHEALLGSEHRQVICFSRSHMAA